MTVIGVISDVLGYGIIAGSALFQFPQIYTILTKHSAEGISLMYYLVETLMFCSSLAWGVANGLPIATYGENVLVFGQLVVVLLLLGYYNGQAMVAWPAAVGLTALTTLMATRTTPDWVLRTTYTSQVALTVLAKLPQVYLNFARKSTGKLNFVTTLLMFGGATARVFTTAVDVSWEQGKLIMAMGFGCGMVLNGMMVAQFFLYLKGEVEAEVEGSSDPSAAVAEGSQSARGEAARRGGRGGGARRRHAYCSDASAPPHMNMAHFDSTSDSSSSDEGMLSGVGMGMGRIVGRAPRPPLAIQTEDPRVGHRRDATCAVPIGVDGDDDELCTRSRAVTPSSAAAVSRIVSHVTSPQREGQSPRHLSTPNDQHN